MIAFSTIYLDARMVLLDVSMEQHGAVRMYVAAVSEDPRVAFKAWRPEDALAQLTTYLYACHAHQAQQPRLTVTIMPAPAPLAYAAAPTPAHTAVPQSAYVLDPRETASRIMDRLCAH